MKICDLCGKKTNELIELDVLYKIDEVKEICLKCEKILEKYTNKVRRYCDNLLIKMRIPFYIKLVNRLRNKNKE